MTSPSRPAHPPRRRPTTLLSLSVLAAAALSGCSVDTDEPGNDHAAARPAPKGVVTVDAARATVDAFEKANNEANRIRGAEGEELLGTVEAGQVHEQSQADYKQSKTWSKAEQKGYGTPLFYTARKYYIPHADQSWFAVTATVSETKSQGLMIFDKVGGRFKMVAAMYADKKTAIPEIAVDRGLATAVDPSKRVGTLAPNQLADAFEDLAETGGKKAGQQLAPTKATKEFTTRYTDRTKAKEASFATVKHFDGKPAHREVYALRLADGGVLALFPSAYTIEYLHKRFMNGGRIIPGPAEAVYNAEQRPLITDEYQGQALAALTPTGKPQVLTHRYTMVNSR
ncbi:hypothetical protein QF035_011074 [Streptomyces umbrinus]|uniref:DUF8094 domain-containing protein n=1 Tax=Streptomyces umbrinus TaxID=67370 RepID=A0ABU0TCV8_9ACTN|nr:hypothetical protein [Streptomyces umbrinus]MDQ1033492.1 hypothetical protein [Streptomyces umbrinus]